MSSEHTGVITFKGNPMTLTGNAVKAGDNAPDFHMVNTSLETVNLAASAGKVRLISVTPSLDTPVCDLQAQRFNAEASKAGGDVVVYNVSLDLPFAQKRWCGANNAENIQTLSDYQQRSFAENYGVMIKELQLMTRAVFVVDKSDKVTYAEIVKEVTEAPDYDAAVAAVKSAQG